MVLALPLLDCFPSRTAGSTVRRSKTNESCDDKPPKNEVLTSWFGIRVAQYCQDCTDSENGGPSSIWLRARLAISPARAVTWGGILVGSGGT